MIRRIANGNRLWLDVTLMLRWVYSAEPEKDKEELVTASFMYAVHTRCWEQKRALASQ